MVTGRVAARSRARRARAHAASRGAGAPTETGNAMTRVSSATRAGGRPPASARHRYPVLRPMPICRHASTVGIPSMISFQYSSSNTSRRLRPRRVISTPLHIAGVLRGGLEPARRHGVSFQTSPTLQTVATVQLLQRSWLPGVAPPHRGVSQSNYKSADPAPGFTMGRHSIRHPSLGA